MKNSRGIKPVITALVCLLMPAVFLTGCRIRLNTEKLEGDLARGLAALMDSDVWMEGTYDDRPPTVEELIESGEIEEETEGKETGYDENGDEKKPPKRVELSEEEIITSTDGMLRYSYSQLSDDEKELYREIYTVLINHTEEVTLASTDADEVDKVFQLVMNDHPEIFYVTGYSMNKYMLGEKTVSLEFDGTYDKSKKEAAAAKPFIDGYVSDCLEGMPEYESDYDKVKYIYEYIIDNTEYDLGARDNQNILSVFVTGKTVCQGYAKATQYLLNELGIPCLLVTGMVKGGEPHAWNLARVDGEWTYIDTTWGDASYRNITTGESWNEITYDYLCVGEDELFGTHHLQSAIELPEAKKLS